MDSPACRVNEDQRQRHNIKELSDRIDSVVDRSDDGGFLGASSVVLTKNSCPINFAKRTLKDKKI
jgi:hypothetical protein